MAILTRLRLRTDFLFPRASFWQGAARVCDLWGALDVYNYSATPEMADARALYADWRVVGQDLEAAMAALDAELAARAAR